MVVKNLKTNSLIISYEFLSDEGKNLKRKQSFGFLPIESTDEDLYEMGQALGNCLKAQPKSIEQNTVYNLTEA